jgi:hypothetical protein
VQPASIASLIVWFAGDAGKDVNRAVIPAYDGGLQRGWFPFLVPS